MGTYQSVDDYISHWVSIDVSYHGDEKQYYARCLWNIMYNGYKGKLEEDYDARKLLIATGSRVIVYTSDDTNDEFFFCGLNKDDTDVANPGKWTGKNMIGLVLMHVRAEIREEWKKNNLDSAEKMRKRQKTEKFICAQSFYTM